MLARAQKGDEKALPELLKLYDENPSLARYVGDVNYHAETDWIALRGRGDLAFKEAAERRMNALRKELAGPHATPLERLLVDRIVLCWYQVNLAEVVCATVIKKSTSQSGDFFERVRDQAHRRFLSSIKALAQVSRLLGPSVQVNIADKQVNVAR